MKTSIASVLYIMKTKNGLFFDVEGIQFQYEKFEANEELVMFINSHNNRVTRWNGSRTFLFSVEIIDIATKYIIE